MYNMSTKREEKIQNDEQHVPGEISTDTNTNAETCDLDNESRDFNSQHNELNSSLKSKFSSYDLEVDPEQEFKATKIKLFSFKRPHMRSFHYAWWCYHVAFLMWFSISPLLKEVQNTLGISKEQIWTSSITAVSGTIVMRFLLGPFCDKYGPRIPMGIVLLISAIPTALTGLVTSAQGLASIRFFIGMGGSTFVMSQYWTTSMFTREWVGTANATVAGWGNVGGGVAQLLVGSFIFPILKLAFNGDASKAWRTACVFPAFLGLVTSVCVIKFTDDCPKGNYSKLKKQKEIADVSIVQSFVGGMLNINTWFLFVQYACCFGVEITMNNAASMYFQDEFYLSTEKAAAVASIFGWMNLFARGLGGFTSDKFNSRLGMRGRLIWQSICLLMEGLMVVLFSRMKSLGPAISVLIFFSIFVQAAEGSTYGIVPYIDSKRSGSVSGIIGAGGNVGAVIFGLCFQRLEARHALLTMGCLIIASATLSSFVFIQGQNSLFFGIQEPLEKDSQSYTGDSKTDVESDGSPRKSPNSAVETSFDENDSGH